MDEVDTLAQVAWRAETKREGEPFSSRIHGGTLT